MNRHTTALRQNATDAERKLWLELRDRRLGGFKFRRQVSLASYVVDFLCVEARVVVELDGGQQDLAGDVTRTAVIEAAGYRILRFWNNDVAANLDGVMAGLLTELQAKALTLPSPRGRGFQR